MNEYLCFIKLIGEKTNGVYQYEFLFIKDISNFDITEDNNPCCLSTNIEPKVYDTIYILNTKIKLDLIQDNCCFSFKHAKLKIVSLAWENMDNYSDYPEDGRLFFRFGETFEEVEEKLAIKNLIMTIKN